MRVEWDASAATPDVLGILAGAGYPASLQEADESQGRASVLHGELGRHIKALAVAGFAAGNVMMLSIAVWSGADGSVRTLFHWISALIAVPALAYSGRIFFDSAWGAVRRGHMNMDVPISIGVLVTAAMSLYDVVIHGEAIYFDAALMLVFFLLVGRTLDQRVRERARHAADAVARFEPRGANVLRPDGSLHAASLASLRVGDRMVVEPGERLAVDAIVEHGHSTVDRSLVTGESMPVEVAPGASVQAGTRNLHAALVVTASTDADGSFLARVRQMMQAAESSQGPHRRMADRAAALYAPVVHAAAALTFIGWFAVTGDLHHAVSVAVAVLIITCPCALGLAVPVVQVLAARRLFDAGVVMKDGAALERLADVDVVVFDKTGTLTTAEMAWSQVQATDSVAGGVAPAPLSLARALARMSQHPHARALMQGEPGTPTAGPVAFDCIEEIPGAGIEGRQGQRVYRLGRADWALGGSRALPATKPTPRPTTRPDFRLTPRLTPQPTPRPIHRPPPRSTTLPTNRSTTGPAGLPAARHRAESVLSLDGRELAGFRFHDTPHADAASCVEALTAEGLRVELLSGDRPEPVARLARTLGIAAARGDALPDDKLEHVQALQQQGQAVLMVGDGVNDSPAMTAASVSIAPFAAVETGRRTADFLLLQDRLLGIPEAIRVARQARRLVRRNLELAVLYNVLALPLAVAGLVTPLLAALSMSLSSVLVVINALRISTGIFSQRSELELEPIAGPITGPIAGPAPDPEHGPMPGPLPGPLHGTRPAPVPEPAREPRTRADTP